MTPKQLAKRREMFDKKMQDPRYLETSYDRAKRLAEERGEIKHGRY